MVTLRVTQEDKAITDVSDAYETIVDMDPNIAAVYAGMMDSQTRKLRTAGYDGTRMGHDDVLDAVWEIDPGTEFARKTTLRQQQAAAGVRNAPSQKANAKTLIPQKPVQEASNYGTPPVQNVNEMFQQFQEFMVATQKAAAIQASRDAVAAPPVRQSQSVPMDEPPVKVTFVNQLGDEIEAEYAAVIVEPLVLVLVSRNTATYRYTPKNPKNALSVRIHGLDGEEPVYVAKPTDVVFEHNGFSYCLLAVVET